MLEDLLYNINKNECLSVCLCVYPADEIWYRDRLDPGQEIG